MCTKLAEHRGDEKVVRGTSASHRKNLAVPEDVLLVTTALFRQIGRSVDDASR
jgi:hypothetical protein